MRKKRVRWSLRAAGRPGEKNISSNIGSAGMPICGQSCVLDMCTPRCAFAPVCPVCSATVRHFAMVSRMPFRGTRTNNKLDALTTVAECYHHCRRQQSKISINSLYSLDSTAFTLQYFCVAESDLRWMPHLLVFVVDSHLEHQQLTYNFNSQRIIRRFP